MTVNETVFLLLREALYGTESTEVIQAEEDGDAFWKQVYDEVKSQAIAGLTSSVVSRHKEIPESIRNEWSRLVRVYPVRYVQMAAAQDKICRLLQDAGIDVAVFKGMAAAIYYPVPENRTMGDVDLIVRPDDYEAAIRILKENGYVLNGDEEGRYHAAFEKYNVLYELHRSPAGIHISDRGETVREYILSGLDAVEMNEIGQDRFPILPWKQNGMELIWHIRQHLYNGLGLRQIIDWMMFVNYFLDDERIGEFMPDLEACGLDQLAKVVTKLCRKYLGLPRDKFTWCDSADEGLCDDLMKFAMEQGNFGHKVEGEKAAKVVSGYSSPGMVMSTLQDVGTHKWELLRKYPVLKPFAFLYGAVDRIGFILRSEGGIGKFLEDVQLGRRRKRMFSRLYGEKKQERVSAAWKKQAGAGASQEQNKKRQVGAGTLQSVKRRVRGVIWSINRSGISSVFKVLADAAATAEYGAYDVFCLLRGYRMPSKEERELVRENVTFIYKSFERQKMARQLYRSIQRFYPGVRVVIADDSRKPLRISGKYATVLHLPFNSGLSYGLNRALEEVDTEYVIRLDDDHLLTRRTHVGEQLQFLKDHPDVDLVGFGLLNALRLETPEEHIRKFYPQSMSYAPRPLKVPHLTRIDETHLVLGKGLNLFLIQTDALRMIGYDDGIRMIDHDDFFYRAAGRIVSVAAEDTRVFHRHNPFDRGYLRYRSDVEGDVKHIQIAHMQKNRVYKE